MNASGEPNCVPVITILPYHDGTLVFGEFLMQKTRANLGVCDTVSVAVLDDTFTGWSIKGRFRGFETRGERLDFVNTLPLLRYNAYTGARAAGTVGHVAMLRRTRAGPFTLAQAISLDKLNAIGQGAPLENVILPLEAGLVDIPALDLSPEAAGAIRQGRVWTGESAHDGLYWGRDSEKRPVALIEALAGRLKVVRGFNL